MSQQETKTSETSKENSAYIRKELTARNKTAQDVAEAMNRSYAFAYVRVQGIKSFTIDELDNIATLIGINSVYELIAASREYAYQQLRGISTWSEITNSPQ